MPTRNVDDSPDEFKRFIEKEQFDFIDGLRGAAVLWVLLHHAFYFFLNRHISEWISNAAAVSPGVGFIAAKGFYALAWMASRGFFGVNLFFVISGFLITGLLLDFLKGRLDIRRFYLRRIFKILPHYYFFIIVAAVSLFFSGSGFSWKLGRNLLPYFIFLNNYLPGISILDHMWSLVVEEQFYIFWSLFLFFLANRPVNEKTRWGLAVGAALAVVVYITLNRISFYRYGMSLLSIFPMSTHPTHGGSMNADGLLMGCVLRLAYVRCPEYFRDISRGRFFYGFGVGVCVILLLLPTNSWGVPGVWFSATFAGIFSILWIMAGLGGAAYLFNARILRQIGKNSYGIYLAHYPVFWWIGLATRSSGFWIFVFAICSAVLLGLLTTATIEKYFLRLRAKISP